MKSCIVTMIYPMIPANAINVCGYWNCQAICFDQIMKNLQKDLKTQKPQLQLQQTGGRLQLDLYKYALIFIMAF